jgi:hypothetical protein
LNHFYPHCSITQITKVTITFIHSSFKSRCFSFF